MVGEDTEQYYRDFVRAMNEIGYEGYIGYELCHQLPVVNGQTVGIEYADQNAQMAAEFMRNLIEAESPASASRDDVAQFVAARQGEMLALRCSSALADRPFIAARRKRLRTRAAKCPLTILHPGSGSRPSF